MATNNVAQIMVGGLQGQPGKIVYGSLEAVELPTGGSDFFPVIIAQGKHDGPVLWVTASIHGDEYTGIQTIHQFITQELVDQLHGTVVAVPTLNPAGLRIGERTAYYLRGQDPNRLFPTPVRTTVVDTIQPDPLPALEAAYRRLYDYISQTADYLIDLHNYSIGAIPFSFRDPVFYRDEDDRSSAAKLQKIVDEMLEAFGHTIINEYVTSDYLKRNLHRSVSGAVLNSARIPAFTVELGGYLTVDPVIVSAAVSGLRNVLRWAEMLEGPAEPIRGVPVVKMDYLIRRTRHPFVPHSGIVRFLVKPGDILKAGDPVARLTDIYGRPLGSEDGLVRTQHDGLVLGITQGAAFYQSDALLSLAIRDDSELLIPFPA